MTGVNTRHIVRLFSKNPAFFLTVILIMALSIGACTAVFSLVKGVLLTGLPYHSADRLAIIWHTQANSAEVIGVWAKDYLTYRDTTHNFQAVGAFSSEGYNLSNGSEPSRITCTRVTSNLLPMLGVAPFRGRWFSSDDDRYGANRTIILSHDLWRSRFGSDGALLGKTIRLDSKPHTVIGIMPSTFVFPIEGMRHASQAECWVPASFSPAEMTMPSFNWIVLGNLKPGVGLGQAQQDASEVAQRILESYPAAVQKEVALRALVISMHEEVTGRTRTPLVVFAGCVGFLLLIGCANVANLILAKLHVRQREIAIRSALGASGSSLARQLLAESVAMAGVGGLSGIPVAFGMLRLLAMFSPGKIPMPDRVHIDTSALIFTVVCSVMSGLVTGLAPAFRVRAVNVSAAMAESSRGSSGGLTHHRIRSLLAVGEIALSLVLLIGAGLLLRSFVKLVTVPPGFDPHNVLTFSVALPEENYNDSTRVRRFVDNVLQGVRAYKEVIFASAGTALPIGFTDATVFSRVGAPPASQGFKPASIQIITPEYLRSFRIKLKRGRPIEVGDDASRIPVALVNQAMVEKYFPDSEVIGQQIYWLVGGRNLTVVGVVADVRQEGLSAPASPAFYLPLAQSPQANRNLVFAIRTSQPAPALAAEVRRIVRQADPALPVFSLQSAEDVVNASTSNERFNMFVVMVFALCALTLSVLGLYAVISYLVIHLSAELGIRMALGATPRRILNMVLGRGLKFLSIGVMIGTLVASMLTRFMKSMLFEITETDPATFVGVIALLTVVAMLAILVPALRATRVDPTVSLR